MSTHATALILGISNFVAFPAGETENRLLLQLPNGRQIAAVISDEDLVAVAGCFGAPQSDLSGGQAKPIPPTPTVSAPSPFTEEVVNDTPAFVFGEPPTPLEEPAPAPAPRPVPAPIPRKARVVGKDDAGNPIVEVLGAATPAEITGTTGERDEDGVAQL